MNFLTADVAIKVDDTRLPAQLAKAKTAVTRTVSAIKTTFSKMATSFKKAFDKMVRYAKWGALAIAGALALVTRAAMKQEDAQFLLAAALKISGEWTLKLQHRFEAFAASIQQVTIYGDEEVLALMQLQKSLGVTSDKLEEATKMSIGLATATGRDVKSMAMYIALAQQGEFTMLRRYIPALRSTTDATEQLKIITEFAAAGFKLAEERAKTTSGSLRQMWNALGDVAEVIGKALLPRIQDTAIAIKEWAERNQARISKWAEIAAEKIGMVIDKIWDLIKVLTTDFSKGMGIVKDIVVKFGAALVDSFVILGIAAGKAFWRGIVEPKVRRADILQSYEKLFGDVERRQIEKALWEDPKMTGEQYDPKKWEQARLAATGDIITKIKEEVNVVDQLKVAWEGVGTAMSEAIPFQWRGVPEGKPSVFGTPSDRAEMDQRAAVATQRHLEGLSRKPSILMGGFEPTAEGGGSLADMKAMKYRNQLVLDMYNETLAEKLKSSDSYLKRLRENDDMSTKAKIENIQLEMDKAAEQYGTQSELYKKLADEQDDYQKQVITGWDNLKMSMSEFYESSMNWGARLGEVLTDAFRSMGAVIVDALTGGEDAWKNFAKMVVKQLLTVIATLLIAVALKAMFDAGASATAGMAVIGPMFKSLAAMSAPRIEGSKQTGGYIEKTGLYRMHEGEKVLTKSEQSASSNFVVNITNNEPVEVTAQRSGPNTVDVFISAMATDGKLRRAIKQTVRS